MQQPNHNQHRKFEPIEITFDEAVKRLADHTGMPMADIRDAIRAGFIRLPRARGFNGGQWVMVDDLNEAIRNTHKRKMLP